MRKRSKKRPLGALCAFVLTAMMLSGFVIPVNAADTQSPVSPALYVLAEEYGMAMAGLTNTGIEFEKDDFKRATNLSKIESVTVTKIPPVADGELRLGNTVITGTQTISAANLSKLSFVAANKNATVSSFKFRVNSSPIDITCSLYMLDKYNASPVLNTESKNFLDVSTHKNVTLYGTLPCYDPEGDETIIEIVSYPETGSLILTDKNTGEYTFTPLGGFSGKDEFKYVARDVYGNYSASATVTVSVTKPTSSVVYSDMIDSPAYNAALTMTEKGIMCGASVGDKTYFYPEQTVSREQFIVMAMNSLGMTKLTNIEKTVFADDSDISDSMRNYIGVAYELGYIKGEVGKDGALCFYPDREITRAEAACILVNMIDAATPTVKVDFDDSKDIPTWAAPSIYSLNYMGIMTADGGNISPNEALTRGSAAEILTALINAEK